MKTHLLAVSIGPVQDFIAAARRTRDLWFGSHMLSEIAKAAAKAVRDCGGKLIFPNPPSDEALGENTDFSVANVILAETDDPASAAKAAEAAARGRWLAFAEEARGKAGRMVRDDVWESQLDDVVEFYSAWTPVSPQTYKDARARAMRLLAARKNCRDFTPFAGRAGLPKSSLDGLRETVLTEGARSAGALRIKPGESLCAVGVTKRVAGEGRFPSVSRVAADPWLRGLVGDEEGKKALKEIGERCERLVREEALSGVRVKSAIFGDFPYEGTALFVDRHPGIEKEAPDDGAAAETLREIRERLAEMHKRFGAPSPYFAVLCADGDRMGRAISKASSPDEHRELTRALSAFASEAAAVVEKHRGVCVYTGGDDVLAFLPCDTALHCARELHDDFGRRLRAAVKECAEEEMPTLSVGIAVGHALEDLADLLKWGRDAERLAKADGSGPAAERDGLAVVVRSRGGAEQFVRERWAPFDAGGGLGSLDRRLLFWAEFCAKGKLPSKFGYEIRSAAEFYRSWTNDESCAEAIRRDLERIFARKDVSLSEDEKRRVGERIVSKLSGADSLERLADELIIGQWFSESIAQSKGGKPSASDDNAA